MQEDRLNIINMQWYVIVLIILCSIAVLLFFILFPIFYLVATKGRIINDKKVFRGLVGTEYLQYESDGKFKITHDRGSYWYIKKGPPNVFFPYYIDELGVILRWSKSHRYLLKIRKSMKDKTTKERYREVFGREIF